MQPYPILTSAHWVRRTLLLIIALVAIGLCSAREANALTTFDRFHHSVSSYDPLNSYLTMLASRKAYHDEFNARSDAQYQTAARTYFINRGFPRVAFIDYDGTSTNALVLSNPNYVLVVFRGSESTRGRVNLPLGIKLPRVATLNAIRDWVSSNAHIKQIRGGRRFGGSKVRVHSGFATAAEAVLDSLKAELSKPQVGAGKGSNKPIFVTGHSLGGAMAALVAMHLGQEGFPVRAAYLHAAPTVGGIVFGAKAVSTGIKYYRTINHVDPVPDLVEAMRKGPAALALAPLPYSHVPAPLYYFDASGKVRKNPSNAFRARERRQARLQSKIPFNAHHGLIYTNRLFSTIPRKDRVGLGVE